MLHLSIRLILAFAVLCSIVLYNPQSTSLPGTLPDDPAREDLGRVVYPSVKKIPWRPHFILPDESLERLFGDRWVWVARFNRVDRRHAYPGMTIKVPLNLEDIAEVIAAEFEPLSDVRGSSEYRTQMIKNHLAQYAQMLKEAQHG